MSAATKPTGLDVGPTRPLSRAERRAAAARVQAERQVAPAEEGPAPVVEPPTSEQTAPEPSTPRSKAPAKSAAPTPAVALRSRKKREKRPFATQLRTGTVARLEWIMRRGYAITDTVDDAINAYLDAAGIPKPDENDRMPEDS